MRLGFNKNKNKEKIQDDDFSKGLEDYLVQYQNNLEHTIQQIKNNFNEEYIVTLKKDIDKVTQQKEQLVKDLNDLNNEFSKNSAQNQNLKATNLNLKTENKNLKIQHKDIKEKIKTLDDEIKVKKNDLANIVVKYISCLSKNKQYSERVKILDEQQQVYIKKVQDLIDSKNNFQLIVDNLIKSIDNQNEVIAENDKRLLYLKQELKDNELLNKQLKQNNIIMSDQKRKLCLDLENLSESLSILKTEKEKLNSNIKALQKQQDTLNYEVKELSIIIKQKKDENEGLELKSALLILQIEKLKTEKSSMKNQIEGSKVNELSNSYLELRETCKELNNEISSKKRTLEEQNKVFKSTCNQINKLIQDKLNLEKQIKQYKSEVFELKVKDEIRKQDIRDRNVPTNINEISNEKIKNVDGELPEKRHLGKESTKNNNVSKVNKIYNSDFQNSEEYIDELLEDFFSDN